MTLTFTEENYLKAIYALSSEPHGRVSNLAIAERLAINPATVTEMLRKLHEKKLIHYNRSDGAKLTASGKTGALQVIRKHRLWETFLVEKLGFSWSEVHEAAEQLEHIQSDKLIERLDKLLDYPKFDPHGDPIPDARGKISNSDARLLAECPAGKKYAMVGVVNHDPSFLHFLDKMNLALNDTIEVREIEDFDKSMHVVLRGKVATVFSYEICKCLLVL